VGRHWISTPEVHDLGLLVAAVLSRDGFPEVAQSACPWAKYGFVEILANLPGKLLRPAALRGNRGPSRFERTSSPTALGRRLKLGRAIRRTMTRMINSGSTSEPLLATTEAVWAWKQ
jgi:hypothetical protein